MINCFQRAQHQSAQIIGLGGGENTTKEVRENGTIKKKVKSQGIKVKMEGKEVTRSDESRENTKRIEINYNQSFLLLPIRIVLVPTPLHYHITTKFVLICSTGALNMRYLGKCQAAKCTYKAT